MKTSLMRSLQGLLALAVATGAQAASLTRTSAFEYDAATGLLTKEIIEPDTPQLRVNTSYTYDAYGNKVSATVSSPAAGTATISSRTTSTSYDARGQFITRSANALGQAETKSFDPATGQPTVLTGPNGMTTVWTYDDGGRKVRETRADATQTTWQYLFCNGVSGGTAACPARGASVVIMRLLANDGATPAGPWSKTYFDILGREVRTETQGFDGTSVIVKDTEYNSLGKVARTSAPYYSGQTPQWTVPSYDALGRVVLTTAPDGSQTRITYDGLVTTTTNALNQTRTEEKDSQGRPVRVTDTTGNTLRYEHDPLGHLVRTIDPAGNTVTLEYDIRGRKTRMIDPDMGTWTYEYNVLGEMTKQTDAKGQVTTMTYDQLGRMVRKATPSLVSTWFYDSCVKGVGKLCSATGDNGYERFHYYDSLGRENRITTKIDTTYASSVTYDANARVNTRTYPNGLVTKYVYTPLGYLAEVRNNATNALYWRADRMDAEGHLLQQTYGNGIVMQQAFEASTGRLRAITAGTNNAVQNLSYTYDALGNLKTRADANQGLTERFDYDALNRLTSATVTSPGAGTVTSTYGYNSIGNITSRSGVGTYRYGVVNMRPHGLTEVQLATGGRRVFTYDANGALTNEIEYDIAGQVVASKGRLVQYTAFGMPLNIMQGGTTLNFVYGPEQQRVRQSANSGASTIYLHPDNAGGMLYEKDIKPNGSVEHKNFITAGGQVMAVVKQVGTTTTVSYLHRDNMGSTAAVTSEAGAVIERLAYEPFGKRRFNDGRLDLSGTIAGINTDRGYTNHEHLDEVGLIHMNGRVYDPVLARFMSADPFIQAPGNLQSYNRYSYVFNSPFMGTDPTGFSAWNKWRRVVGAIVVAYFTAGMANAAYMSTVTTTTMGGYTVTTATVIAGTSIQTTAAIISGAAGGFAGSLVGSGGDLRAAAKGAVAGALFGWAGRVGDSSSASTYAAHAVAGCAEGAMSGQGCGRGAASALVGKYVTNAVDDWHFVPKGIATVVAGGTVAVIGGGKFESGAKTAAFGYLFNSMSDTWEDKLNLKAYAKSHPMETEMFTDMLKGVPGYVVFNDSSLANVIVGFEGYVQERAIRYMSVDYAKFQDAAFGARTFDPGSWIDRIVGASDARDVAMLPRRAMEFATIRANQGPQVFNRAWYEQNFGKPPHPWSAYGKGWDWR